MKQEEVVLMKSLDFKSSYLQERLLKDAIVYIFIQMVSGLNEQNIGVREILWRKQVIYICICVSFFKGHLRTGSF